jgi:hypothetical protein
MLANDWRQEHRFIRYIVASIPDVRECRQHGGQSLASVQRLVEPLLYHMRIRSCCFDFEARDLQAQRPLARVGVDPRLPGVDAASCGDRFRETISSFVFETFSFDSADSKPTGALQEESPGNIGANRFVRAAIEDRSGGATRDTACGCGDVPFLPAHLCEDVVDDRFGSALGAGMAVERTPCASEDGKIIGEDQTGNRCEFGRVVFDPVQCAIKIAEEHVMRACLDTQT